MSETKEWAVVISSTSWFRPEYSDAEAFRVEKTSEKMVMGRALYRNRHPKHEVRAGLSEAEAKAIAAEILGKIKFAKDVIRREQDALTQEIKSVLGQ